MPQRRQPTDDEPLEATPEQIERIEKHFGRLVAFEDAAIASIFGTLPEWLPEPIEPRVRRLITILGIAGQSPKRMGELVADDDFEVPGSARDPIAFIDAVNEIAHVKRVLSLGKSRALKELAGRSAAVGQTSIENLNRLTAQGNAEKIRLAEENQVKWRKIGEPIRLKHPTKSDTWIAEQIAKKSGGKISTIRASMKKLGLSKN